MDNPPNKSGLIFKPFLLSSIDRQIVLRYNLQKRYYFSKYKSKLNTGFVNIMEYVRKFSFNIGHP